MNQWVNEQAIQKERARALELLEDHCDWSNENPSAKAIAYRGLYLQCKDFDAALKEEALHD